MKQMPGNDAIFLAIDSPNALAQIGGIAILDPSETASIVVLGTEDECVSDGRVCYLPLGNDLPTGRYRIRVQHDVPSQGYVVLSKTTPGETTAKREMWYERPDFSLAD